MQRVDIAIGVIALVALAGSLIGLSLYDESEYHRYDVRVDEHDGSAGTVWGDGGLVGPAGGDASEDETTWTTNQANLTRITFTIEISSTMTLRSGDTVVEVEISHGDENISARSTTLTIPESADSGSDDGTIQFDIQDTPQGETNVLAQTADAAVLDEEDQPYVPTTFNGTGDWTIRATITEGGALSVAGQVVEPEEIDVEVSADYRYYSARGELRLPEGGSAI